MTLLKRLTIDRLPVEIHATEESMGESAAKAAHDYILSLGDRPLNIIFAAAVSQDAFLKALFSYQDIPWHRISAFHMDEYIGVGNDDPNSLTHFLVSRSLKDTPLRGRFFMNGAAENPEAEARRYAKLLKENPPDISFVGVGDNGHLAFNEPAVADFHDQEAVKLVEIDSLSKTQQVLSGNFPDENSVPSYAFTITVPVLMSAARVFCIAPGISKAAAVRDVLLGPIDERCPASILRRHENASMYLDAHSASSLMESL